MKIKSISMFLIIAAAIFLTSCENCKMDSDDLGTPVAGKVLFNKKNDGSQIMIWCLDESGNVIDTKVYGPFPGWHVVNYADNRILWYNRESGNTIVSLWIMDDHGNQIAYKEHQGGLDWMPMCYSDGKILWAKPGGGLAALWTVDENGTVVDKDDYSIDNSWSPKGYSNGKILWGKYDNTGLSGSAQLTFLDVSGNIINSKSYGPFYGWGLNRLSFDDNKILWDYYSVNKGISLWAIDAQGNQTTYKEYYGPFHPNLPGVYSDGKLLIRYADLVNFSLWTIDGNCNKTGSKDYKNPDGWYATQYAN